MTDFSSQIAAALASVRAVESRKINTAVILGSGLGDISPELSNMKEFEYSDIENLNTPSVQSHHGRLQVGELNSQCIAICQGRHHLYEGYSAQDVALLVYLLASLGTRRLIITNAAGALNPSYQAGDVMLIEDHINFTGHNPIVGQSDPMGERFVDMSRAYQPALLAQAKQAALENELSIHQGVYAGVLGPSLETSAERRMLAKLGGDAVGMSTVIEVIAANQCGMEVLGLSAITNMALGDTNQQVDTIEEVIRYAGIAGKKIGIIIDSILAE